MGKRLTLVLAACAVAAAAPPVSAKKGRGDITHFEPRTSDDLPNVQSPSAIVIDMKSGDVLYSRNADEVRPIASTGKLLVAVTARRWNIPLTEPTAITDADRELARGGARTRLHVGYAYQNGDLLRAMLIASDNRAPNAVGRALGFDTEDWIAAINELARALGLHRTSFTDPSGLNGNVSTAREMAEVFRLAWTDPLLAEILSTHETHVTSTGPRKVVVKYFNTNRALARTSYEVLGGKTGYTDEAGYCLVIGARIGEREVVMVFLGSWGKLTRYGDFGRVADWIRDGMPNAALAIAEEAPQAHGTR